jgi:F-box and WD-40 domain protein 1/11
VSASGDRLIKLWDVKTGKCLKTIQGHQKGIACVQFDGKRIVSGSSDETVRIFDGVTGAEVACLRGHKNLVRTVQARFGDVPGSEADLELEARSVDRQFFQAQMDGSLQRGQLTREQRRARNAGSSNPNELFAVGAKLPPGGGGGKWARIVSGSYDESVIIWKRDGEGKWIPAQQLLQSEAVVGAGGQPRQQPAPPAVQVQGPMPMPHPNLHPQVQMNPQMNAAAVTQWNFQQWLQQNGHMLTGQQVAQMQAQMAHNLLLLNAAHGANAGGNAAQAQAPTFAQAVQQSAPTAAPVAGPPSSSMAAQAGSSTSNAAASSSSRTSTANASTSGSSTPASTSTTPQPQPQLQPQPAPSVAQQALQNAVPQNWPALPHHPPAAVPHHHHHHHHHTQPQPPTAANSRVFKLQFDSRRIICCSQDPTIVGWDFADGDKDIEEASRFFAGEDF